MRPKTETMLPDVAWILFSVEAMTAREGAVVDGFMQGLREGAGLFPQTPSPFTLPAGPAGHSVLPAVSKFSKMR